ncbi:YxcD family protein [Metabacillus fastidiosus]|uniref:YxcD family protein n=1 Tax=Metabacillus fastidiosus TaxID=1458 RepID=UPI002DBE4842|nr:YxcD family protein [Metabacillus fastidiosus]MEC2075229.1 YxcD family protein [Metabacillus fastidiosus]
MEKITLSEQDIINALCLHIAFKRQITPQEVEIELMYDDDYGFSAESYVNDRKQVLITANIIEAIRFFLDTEMSIDPFSARIELVLDDEEGIIAYIG